MDKPIEINIKGVKVIYLTKPGVFAKHGLDDGTKLLLEAVEIKEGTLTADLGGGAGIISLVIAKLLRKGHVHLLDDHLRSVELAKKNVEINDLTNIEVYLSDLFSAVEGRTYHQVLSNPPQQLGNEFLLEIVEESKKHLKPQGQFLVVVKNNIKPVMERFMKQVFGQVVTVTTSKEHVVLKTTKVD